ncbi:MAG: TlpA family protein disulfide reductase [Candidatus Eisenbacteria bacterium]|nr:TlpA family protein disulfide reductase [Candidatus Eisenbacteria bacterium]
MTVRFSRSALPTSLLLAALLAVLATGCAQRKEAPATEAAHGGAGQAVNTPPEAPAGEVQATPGGEKPWPAPAFELKTVDGGTARMADLKGKVVLVDFWATWCPPCKKEIPHLVTLYDRYKDKGLVVLGVADDPNDHSRVAPFVTKNQIPYPVAYSVEGTADSFGGLVGYPTVFVINRDGQVVGKFIGYTDESTLEAAVQKLL